MLSPTWQKLLLLAALVTAALSRPQTQTKSEDVDWHLVPLIPAAAAAGNSGNTKAAADAELPVPGSSDSSGSSSGPHAINNAHAAEYRRARIGDVSSSTSSTGTSSIGTSSTSTTNPEQTSTYLTSSQHQTRVEKKATPIIGDSIKKLANQLLVMNSTTTNDKPARKKMGDQSEAKAHAGVAVPMTMEELEKELSSKGQQQMTTSSGLSTWVLLSGVHSTTTPNSLDKINGTTLKKIKPTPSGYMKTGRPVITMVTRKDQITPKPGNTTTRIMVQSGPLLTKVKASVLADTLKNKSSEKITTTIDAMQSSTTPKIVTKRTTNYPLSTTTARTTTMSKKIEEEDSTTPALDDKITTFSSVESKEGAMEIIESREAPTTKKPKRGNNAAQANKRKKPNKNRRRPGNSTEKTLEAETKTKNSTKTALQAKKPISTQIYNYLSREVVPTVGMGLVGLMVTAGLTYFLYPFGGLRRSYTVDRKDDLYYYGADELANADGQSEEEVFGKVIAGMPASQLYPNMNQQVYGVNNNNNRQQIYNRQNQPPAQQQKIPPAHQKRPVYRNLHPVYSSRQGYVYPENIGYNTHASSEMLQAQQRNAVADDMEIDAQPSSAIVDEKLFEPMAAEPLIETTVKTSDGSSTPSSIDGKQFVVGNIPKELLEPSIVPEHGPRRRKRRSVDDELDNEIVPVTNKYGGNRVENGPMNTSEKPKEVVNIIEHREVPTTDAEIDNENSTDITNLIDDGTPMSSSTSKNPGDGRVDGTTEGYPATANGTTNIVDFIKQLINFKLRLGLGLLQRTTEVLSRYLHGTPVERDGMSTPRLY